MSFIFRCDICQNFLGISIPTYTRTKTVRQNAHAVILDDKIKSVIAFIYRITVRQNAHAVILDDKIKSVIAFIYRISGSNPGIPQHDRPQLVFLRQVVRIENTAIKSLYQL